MSTFFTVTYDHWDDLPIGLWLVSNTIPGRVEIINDEHSRSVDEFVMLPSNWEFIGLDIIDPYQCDVIYVAEP